VRSGSIAAGRLLKCDVRTVSLSKYWSFCLAGLLLGLGYPGPGGAQTADFEKEVAAFEKQDAKFPPPANAIVITGSSTIRLWTSVRNDLAPLDVIARGFGGSTADDLDYYLDRLVLTYAPRAVAIYEGDTDLSVGMTPEYIVSRIGQIAARIAAELPATRIYFISIKPSPKRWVYWPQAVLANQMLAQSCATLPQCVYIDTASALLNPDGSLNMGYYASDRVHLNAAGYAVWTGVMKPALTIGEKSSIAMPEFRTADVGFVSAPGSTTEGGGVLTVEGSGTGVYGSLDGFRYAYRHLTGNGQVTVRLASQQDAAANALAGVMLREKLTPESRHVLVYSTPTAGTGMMYRTVAGAPPGPGVVQQPGLTAPRWLKLDRKSTTVTGYLSADGIAWQQVGVIKFSSLPSKLYVGVAVSSQADGILGSASFDNVWVYGTTATPPPPPIDITAPKKPTSLAAKALSAEQIKLTWTKSTDYSETGVAGYKVFRDGILAGTTSTTGWTDHGLTPNTSYVYKVSAFDKATPTNESLPSASASAKTWVAP
jgi:lysophospholipase L1-like esterase